MSRTIFRKVVLVIMAAAVSMSFTACMRNLDVKNAGEIADLLKQKYGVEFAVKSIGDRLSSGNGATVTAYCYPKDNNSILFEAKMHVSGELVSDNYLAAVLEEEARKLIETAYEENGITAAADVTILRLPEDGGIQGKSLSQVVAANPSILLSFTTVMHEDCDAEAVYDTTTSILRSLYSGDQGMSLGTTIWKYGNDAYQECISVMQGVPHIDRTFLESKAPLSKINVAIKDGQVTIDRETFLENFR